MAVVGVLGLSSCMDTGTYRSTANYTLVDNISYVTNLETGATALLAGANYDWYYVIENNDASVTVKITNLQVSSTGSRLTFELPDLKYSTTEGVTTATVDVASSNGHTISDFVYKQYTRVLMDAQKQVTYYEISFVVDDVYSVKVLPASNTVEGITDVTNPDDEKSVSSYTPYFSYELDLDKKTAIFTIFRLSVGGQSFSEITFMNVPFKVSSGYQFDIESVGEITPVGIDGRPIEQLKTQKFSVSSTFNSDFYGSFTTDRGYEVKFHGSPKSLRPVEGQN